MAGNEQTFTDWQGGYDPQGGETHPTLGPAPHFRDAKDRKLSAFGATPDTLYPGGYLGTQESNRRQDKLVSAVLRSNTRSYSRGTHKGERINPGDYAWPEEFHPLAGIERQMQPGPTMRHTLPQADPVRLTNDGKAGPRGVPSNHLRRPHMEIVNAQRSSMLKSLLPAWR